MFVSPGNMVQLQRLDPASLPVMASRLLSALVMEIVGLMPSIVIR